MQNVLIHPRVSVVRPYGSLCAAEAMQFQNQLHIAVLSEQTVGVLIDLRQVDAIDSAGLMAIVAAWKLAKRFNKRVSFCSISASVRMIFELTRLDQVFEIAEEPAKVDRWAA